MNIPKRFAICGLVLAVTAPAFGAAPAAPPSVPPTEPAVAVRIVRYASGKCARAFDPADLRVKVGTTVQFRNDDWEVHTVVSAAGEDPCNFEDVERGARVIDLGQLPPGVTLMHTFAAPGVYRYMCHLPGHHMGGVITVEP